MASTSRAALATIFASVLAVSACGSGSGSEGAITFVGYGSAFQDNQKLAWQDPYTEAHDVSFVNDGPTSIAKVETMVGSGNVTWDVMDTGAADAIQHCGTLFEPLDLSGVDQSQFPEGSISECGMPDYYFGLTFLYNTQKFGDNPPTSISDFFDTAKYPGARMLPPEVNAGILEQALLADGVQPENLYPLDVGRALSKLDTIKGNSTFATTYGQMQQAMVDNQVDMVLTVTARAVTSIKAGATFEPVWDRTILSADNLVVPKGGPNTDKAMDFIAFATSPEQSEKFAALANVVPSNLNAKPEYDEVGQKLNPYAPEHRDSVVIQDAQWWGENSAATKAAYSNWQQG